MGTSAGEYRQIGTAHHSFRREGGSGAMSTPLLECPRCGAVVTDQEKHDSWHARVAVGMDFGIFS